MISFTTASQASQEQLNKLDVRQSIYQSNNLVDVIVLSIAKVTAAFEIIENELFGGYLYKIKKKIL